MPAEEVPITYFNVPKVPGATPDGFNLQVFDEVLNQFVDVPDTEGGPVRALKRGGRVQAFKTGGRATIADMARHYGARR
jgi:hypothetical protein